MREPDSSSKPKQAVSLNDLLQANRAQFDKIFGVQREELGLLRSSQIPLTRDDLGSASMRSSAARSALGADSENLIAQFLSEALGSDWHYDVVERKTESGRVTVLCKLSQNGTSRMQFGASQINGSPEEAEQRAILDAVKKAARLISAGTSAGASAGAVSDSRGADAEEALPEWMAPAPASPNRQRAHAAAEVRATSREMGGISVDSGTGGALSTYTHSPQAIGGNVLDPITLDLIENALRNARHEMDAVLFRSAMSPVIREQHDEFPMITDAKGRMIVGQFGSYVTEMLAENALEFHPGDAILQSDPFRCGGAISHINDWMVLVPIFHENVLVGFSSMFGHMMDVGGSVPGSMPTAATSIFAEGIKIPPVKIYEKGVRNQGVLDVILNNTRTPEMNHSDLMAITAGCRAGEKRVVEICERFGQDTYLEACNALLDRTNRAMRNLIVQNLPEEPQSFEDYVDDDGCGNGPFKMKLTVWREGDHAYFDWTGTSPQAEGPINFYLHEGMFKMFVGVYMIMVFDPQILFNDGFYDLIHVTLPKGSLVNPNFPAPLGCRTHTLARQFDVMGGALSKKAPELATAAGYGSSPHLLYNGTDKDGRFFQLMEILYGGIPGRPVGDGMDGHAWWPLFENIPAEYLEAYYPLIIEKYTTTADSGGAGLHRGGNGIEKIYYMLEPGEISIHDDRHVTQPWGILGGKPGQCSEKWLVRQDGSREPLPSKVDHVKVIPGDRIIFCTAGGGGWGDPLERPPLAVRNDVARGLVSEKKARDEYGVVVLGPDREIDARATESLREELRRTRDPLPTFDFGRQPGIAVGEAIGESVN